MAVDRNVQPEPLQEELLFQWSRVLPWAFDILTELVAFLGDCELRLWLKLGWKSFYFLCPLSHASANMLSMFAPELSQFMDQCIKPTGTKFGLPQCAGLEPAVVQLLRVAYSSLDRNQGDGWSSYLGAGIFMLS